MSKNAMWRTLIVLFSVSGAVLIVCTFYAMHMVQRGFSTRTPPSKAETVIATAMLEASWPARYKAMKNPVAATPEVVHEGLAHYADHCAQCHGNNGSGNGMYGQTLYPRPPNLAGAETQSMSDGQLYYPIAYGIRLSGMPAFGKASDDDIDSWKLVAFIRHLPKLTPQEEQEMEHLNPKGPDEWREQQEEDLFLNGAHSSATAAQHSPHEGD